MGVRLWRPDNPTPSSWYCPSGSSLSPVNKTEKVMRSSCTWEGGEIRWGPWGYEVKFEECLQKDVGVPKQIKLNQDFFFMRHGMNRFTFRALEEKRGNRGLRSPAIIVLGHLPVVAQAVSLCSLSCLCCPLWSGQLILTHQNLKLPIYKGLSLLTKFVL